MSEHTDGPTDGPPHGSAAYWDQRYGEREALWSKEANPLVVELVAPLAPGRALDVGCGEGADAVWLAGRGWQVTGVDLSRVALDRAAERAEAEGVADRVGWVAGDAADDAPLPDEVDLVSLQFIHLPPTERRHLHSRLAARVAPGGSVLVVAHHPDDVEAGVRRPAPELLLTPDDVVAAFDEADWEPVVSEVRARPGRSHEGADVTVHDTVVHLRRRSDPETDATDEDKRLGTGPGE